ncbi:sugar transferase [Acidaminobacter sp. JC074]|uniref:sugar transferase n=1 Tax=Acidaminobacter sp. JC074 TaxID=2530199 RepID=UPI001F0D73B2|nr:sugar transferase [Acidaminobacter sp. JC074]MCH4889711.1 sugar transferase [Acidaminobacter sp. JC074]
MYEKYFKRIFDILVCIIGLPIFLIIFVGVCIAIKIEDGGPIFYNANRIGKDFKLFKMYKFRSMKVNAPYILMEDGTTFSSDHDERVTKVGHFIRLTSLDETPQLLNVLKNDMSLIGPRASLEDSIDTFLKDEVDKMKVKPGITGYSQAYYRNNKSSREKRVVDAWYANHVSLKLDLRIFFKTFTTVLNHRGVYSNHED